MILGSGGIQKKVLGEIKKKDNRGKLLCIYTEFFFEYYYLLKLTG